ncbi:LCP family protein [Paenisporosarcina quisquiliarum]|uniref:Regulatory protein MsrR n=1 Tax=Paenisporosarcina quisquiliarum TaxID=365346 RepID=A0A9X3LDA4_9BACL|nr:LCP family protein [Paenisporosarcina quisquiliarum]MCZ8535898.1 LCP family protein [Paenisporosarcina quisquiliarum]
MEEQVPNRRSMRKKRKFRYGRFFMTLLFLAFIGIAIYSVVQFKAGQELASHKEKNNIEFTGDPLDVKNPAIENILVLGVDTRGEEQSRTDTMMLVSWNKETDEVNVVSFMRDIYAQIPGYKSYKLNTAYYLDGVQLVKDTISSMFGVPIHHYALIDFKSFESLVDIVAPNGVEIEVEKAMSEKIGVSLEPGVQQLNGKELLGYARFRADSEGDFGRVARQQKVMEALKDEVLSPSNSVNYPKFAGAIQGYVQSDYSTTEEVKRVLDLAFSGGVDINNMTIPVEHSYDYGSYPGVGSVIEINVEENKQALSEFLGMRLR